MTLTKAFDPTALVTALKSAGIADSEKLVNDELPIIFDWLNTSVGMEFAGSMGLIAAEVLSLLENKALAELNVLESKI